MTFLKLISWLEREPAIRKKDAKDIYYLMRTYSKIPIILNRMYDENYMEAQEWDEQKASVAILGQDVANQLNQKIFDYLKESLFSKSEKLELLLKEMNSNFQALAYEQSEFKILIDSIMIDFLNNHETM